jgi:hypothetical protein
MYKVELGGGTTITAACVNVLPNPMGGIHTVECRAIDSFFIPCAGLITSERLAFHVSNIEKVLWRTNLRETSEEWQVVFCRETVSSRKYYKYWKAAAVTLLLWTPESLRDGIPLAEIPDLAVVHYKRKERKKGKRQ